MVITGLTRNQLAGQPARGFESRRLRFFMRFTMQKTIFRTIQKILFIVIGLLVLANAFFAFRVSNMNVGIILTFLLGVIFLLYGIFLNTIIKKFPTWIKCLFYIGIVAIVVVIPVLLISGTTDNVTYKEDAIIVLGAAVYGEEPSGALINRLDASIEYYNKNPDAVIVVSGGQGPQEDITEALAMERYLLSKGIPQDKIIKEERSTSTHENFKYSKELLDEYFDGKSYTIAFVTNDYHTYRAGSIAKLAGFENVRHCHSKTSWRIALPSCLRECLAIVQLWIFKR